MATAATTATIGGSTTRDTTRVTRLHEKIELGHIGERLTAYIDRVKELGDKRPQLETLLQTTRLLEEEISSLKETYEVEIAEARRLVDETANENARLQLETSRSQKLSRELQQRLSDEISLRRRAEGNRTLVERALEHKEHQLQEAIRDQEPPKRALAIVSRERDELEMALISSKEALEREALLRAEAQNDLETKREEFGFRVKVLQQELDTKAARIDQLEDLLVLKEEQLNREHRDALDAALAEARIKTEEELNRYRFESEAILKTRIDELTLKHESDVARLHQITDENLELTAEVELLKERNKSFDERVIELEKTVSSIDRALEQEKVQRNADNTENELRIENLRATLYQKETDYQELMDLHIPLDQEIKRLRRLIEDEEKRLGLKIYNMTSRSQQSETRIGRPATAPGVLTASLLKSARTGTAYIDGRQEQKQKEQQEQQETLSFWSSHVVDETSSYSTNQIKVWDVDRRGNFVKLLNTSNQAQSLGGYNIRQTSSGNQLVAVYKFPQRFIMQPGATVTIWSAKSRALHNPPSDLLWTDQASWATGLGTNTTLHNMYGQAVAGLNTNRQQKDAAFPKIPEADSRERSGIFRSLKKEHSANLPFDMPKSRQRRSRQERTDASFSSRNHQAHFTGSRFVQHQLSTK
ncbi:lamin-B1.S-like [Oscarella lobularis]|uniref:lamin-B1.S-like n=1 Tax=Oscarella lobularis TaxID=121494 RepID=UPI003313841F